MTWTLSTPLHAWGRPDFAQVLQDELLRCNALAGPTFACWTF